MSFRQKSEEVVDAFVSKQSAHFLSSRLWLTLVTLLNQGNTHLTNATKLSNLYITSREKWTVLTTLLTVESLTLNIKARNKLLSELQIHHL
jgi:hypothetical protein